MNIANVMLEQARIRPDAAAIIASKNGRDQTMTFRELADASGRVAQQLREAGLSPGSNVLLLVPMSPELYAVLVGLFRAGMVPTILDPSAGRKHIERCCDLSKPDAFIGTRKAHLLRFLSNRIRGIAKKFCVGPGWPFCRSLQLYGEEVSDGSVAELDYNSPALLTFTSGSTGLPKAVVRSHGFLLAQHRVLERSISLVPGQIDLTTLPVFVLANLGSGVTSVIPDCDLRQPGQIDSAPVLAQIMRHGITRTAASPAFIERLLEDESAAEAELQQVFTGGAPVFPGLLQRIRSTWPACLPVSVYGSTEAEPIAHLSCDEISLADLQSMRNGRGLLAGKPVEEIQIAIIPNRWGTPLGPFSENEFNSLQLAKGASGEIVVSGEHVLSGYLHGRGDAETKFQVKGRTWHRTGDAGFFDEQHRLWLLGRCSARIVDLDGELYPFAAECVAMQFDWLRRAGCVAVDRHRYLAVQASRTPSANEREELESAAACCGIKSIVFFETLPVDTRHNAKIDYQKLKALVAKALRTAE